MRLRRHTSSSQAHHSCPCWVRGLVHVIATAGPVTDVPDEGSGSARARSGPLTAHELGAVTGSLRPTLSARGAVTVDHRAAPCGRSEVSVRWPSKEEPMHSEDDRRSIPTDRRLVGVDLGIASDHTVRVLRGDGSGVCRRRTRPTVESLTLLETAALTGAPAGTRLEVVMEPTGPAAAAGTGEPAAAGVARGRGRRPGPPGPGLRPVDPAGGAAPAADQGPGASADAGHAADRGVDQDRPGGPRALGRPPSPAGRRSVPAAGPDHQNFPRPAGRGPHRRLAGGGAGRGGPLRRAPGGAYSDLAAEVGTEVRLLQAVRAELTGHAEARADAYRWTDPAHLAASLPGLAEVGAPTVTAIVGRAARFRTGKAFRSFTGLAPGASETGETDRKGQPMSKAGNRLLRTTLVRAADNARRVDPQLAQIYYTQLVERGPDQG